MKTCNNQSCNKDISKLHPLKKYCSDQCRDIGYKSSPEIQKKLKEYNSEYKKKLKSKRA